MANSPQAKKRARQAVKRRAANMSKRSETRTSVKKVIAAIEAGDQAVAQAALIEASSKLDKMAQKGLYHKNKAARQKSNLSKAIKAMA